MNSDLFYNVMSFTDTKNPIVLGKLVQLNSAFHKRYNWQQKVNAAVMTEFSNNCILFAPVGRTFQIKQWLSDPSGLIPKVESMFDINYVNVEVTCIKEDENTIKAYAHIDAEDSYYSSDVMNVKLTAKRGLGFETSSKSRYDDMYADVSSVVWLVLCGVESFPETNEEIMNKFCKANFDRCLATILECSPKHDIYKSSTIILAVYDGIICLEYEITKVKRNRRYITFKVGFTPNFDPEYTMVVDAYYECNKKQLCFMNDLAHYTYKVNRNFFVPCYDNNCNYYEFPEALHNFLVGMHPFI